MRNPVARVRAWLWLFSLCGAWLGLTTPETRADGKVMPPLLVPQEVTMPDQRALLAWSGGVETLVIESAFVGKGTDFAWVVPLPTKPEVELATRGTLASVAALMQPVVVPPERDLWWLPGALAVVAIWTLLLGWKSAGLLLRVVVVATLGAVFGVVLAAIVGFAWVIVPLSIAMACWGGRELIRRKDSLLSYLLVVLFGLLLFAMMIPSFGKVRSLGGPVVEVGGVTVERGLVGDFDVSLVSGREGDGVVGWLRENGYAIDGAAEAVAREHAAAGGWFVASRVRREFAESGRSVPAPLLFRFAAERPVYPMRLTGAGAKEALELELFVFGPERAVAEGLETVAWGPWREGNPQELYGRRATGQPRDARVVSHPVLARVAKGTAVVSRLRGKLTPEQMQADIRPRWEAGAEASHDLVAWASEAAAQAALAAGGGLALIVSIWLGFRQGGRRQPWRRSMAVVGAGLATGAVVFAALPSVATREVHSGKSIPWYAVRQVPQVAALALWELDPATTSDDAARAAFAAEFRKFLDGSGWKMEIGDAPGQVELVKTPEGKWRTILYDGAGQARYRAEEDFELGFGRESGVKTSGSAR
ncbi:MAG: DUF2330 domain-containing protein [Burkholderiales bacterium]|nr:DUF2330 domain-containing protein [Opitutaceae bacterium]